MILLGVNNRSDLVKKLFNMIRKLVDDVEGLLRGLAKSGSDK